MASNENASNKRRKEKDEKDNSKSFTPREYQIEILEAAKKTNTIACLGTGTGKTFIAVMLIREHAAEVRTPFEKGGKRIFFLVPTVPLVTQQAKTIKEHTDLNVGTYYGDMDVDSWNKDEWIKEFVGQEVLVMTAEIFRIIVEHAFIPIAQIQLLVIDECHRAQGDHPYRQAMKNIYSKTEKMPRIFGLSASLLNGKCEPSKLEKSLTDLEKTLYSTILTASDIVDLRKYGTDPTEFVILFSKYDSAAGDLLKETMQLINKIEAQKSPDRKERSQNEICIPVSDDVTFFSKPKKCLKSLINTLTNLGPWCACKAAEIYSREVQVLLKKPFNDKFRCLLTEIRDFLIYFIEVCRCLDSSGPEFENMPKKLQRLIQIFLAARNSPLFQNEDVMIIEDMTMGNDPVKYYKSLNIRQQSEAIQVSSIVFVEQRITAYVLQLWLMEMKQTFPDLDFLKPEFIVGHGNMGTAETSMSEKVQQRKLKDFRTQKCNVLVATQVLEEGMDIRQCNLVIRFDLPWDFRSYVQSKGRARAKNSIYVLLIEEGETLSKFFTDLINFKTIEKMLMTKCHDRTLPSEEEIAIHMNDNDIPPYMPRGPDGPCITMNAAISLINRYCSSLPSDMATKLVPQWQMRIVDPDVLQKEYECTLRMPINSPLRQPIIGNTMRKKKLAKMSAALKACELLDEMGELNENLVPISCLVDDAIEQELGEIEEEEDNGAIPGTNRSRRVYDKRVPIFLKDSKPLPSEPCYLSIITMYLVQPLPKSLNPRQRPIINPADTPRGLALLTTKTLPPVNPFRIYSKIGKILVTITAMDSPVALSHQDILKIEEFHRFIFSDTLWIEGMKGFAPLAASASYYILPINKDKLQRYEIDWEFINATKNHPYNEQKLKTPQTVKRTIFKTEDFEDSVLMRSYKLDMWKQERPSFHHVVKICHDLSPKSTFLCDNKYKTYKEYFDKKYNAIIVNDDQPLIETVQTGGLHMWKPLYLSPKETFEDKAILSKSKQKHKNYREYLVPEISILHPLPSTFFFKVTCLPTVLFRLNELLLAEEIRQVVAREAHVGTVHLEDGFNWPPFNLETSDKGLTSYLNRISGELEEGELEEDNNENKLVPRDIIKDTYSNKIISFEAKIDLKNFTGPSPSLILQTLTAKSAGDEFDLERLEMIGDSFLKYVMSIKTYIKYRTFDEGRLTRVRSSLIQNRYLYQKAKKKSLPEYLTTTVFSCGTTWLPPCYVIEEFVDKSTVVKKPKKKSIDGVVEKSESPLHLYFTKQVISDKCIADSVEALIGAYLLTCGQKGALRFMAWLGLNPLLEKEFVESDFENWPPPPPNPIVVENTPEVPGALESLTSGFERFEKSIGYKFKNKAYLLQALTHPSYSYNVITDCYQRLEFLGDAVLDYLITRQLYEDPSGHSPGKLTDLRSALVNNNYFASLAVKYNYHSYLKMLSPTLFKLMDEYVKILKDSDAFKFFEEHSYYLEEIECFELEEVEVPKALGDVFESVAGAIYLDSGMSPDTVWEVCFPMIEPAMKHLCEFVPVSPVRELFERVKTQNIFGEAIQQQEKTYIDVILPDGRKFGGVGPNKKIAKRSAAKRALSELKHAERMDTS